VTLDGKLPGRLSGEYKVDLPRPREHTDVEFLSLRRKITESTQLIL
jgi:NitT/TauT family transport system ATP-binding protein/sulfonate transport system ATP-binding protein